MTPVLNSFELDGVRLFYGLENVGSAEKDALKSKMGLTRTP